jgi:hypothetical protein
VLLDEWMWRTKGGRGKSIVVRCFVLRPMDGVDGCQWVWRVGFGEVSGIFAGCYRFGRWVGEMDLRETGYDGVDDMLSSRWTLVENHGRKIWLDHTRDANHEAVSVGRVCEKHRANNVHM